MLSQSSLDFLSDLRANNKREWFQENKKRYEAELKKPGALFALAFANTLGEKLGQEQQAKVYRINRDVRFSKDKTPYNSHLHISTCFDPKTDAPAFMFGIEPNKLTLGMGCMGFSKTGLDKWRAGVDGKQGALFANEVSKLQAKGFRISEPNLKRVPTPYSQDHERAEFLKYKGFMLWLDMSDETFAFGENGPEKCASKLEQSFPVYEILSKFVS